MVDKPIRSDIADARARDWMSHRVQAGENEITEGIQNRDPRYSVIYNDLRRRAQEMMDPQLSSPEHLSSDLFNQWRLKEIQALEKAWVQNLRSAFQFARKHMYVFLRFWPANQQFPNLVPWIHQAKSKPEDSFNLLAFSFRGPLRTVKDIFVHVPWSSLGWPGAMAWNSFVARSTLKYRWKVYWRTLKRLKRASHENFSTRMDSHPILKFRLGAITGKLGNELLAELHDSAKISVPSKVSLQLRNILRQGQLLQRMIGDLNALPAHSNQSWLALLEILREKYRLDAKNNFGSAFDKNWTSQVDISDTLSIYHAFDREDAVSNLIWYFYSSDLRSAAARDSLAETRGLKHFDENSILNQSSAKKSPPQVNTSRGDLEDRYLKAKLWKRRALHILTTALVLGATFVGTELVESIVDGFGAPNEMPGLNSGNPSNHRMDEASDSRGKSIYSLQAGDLGTFRSPVVKQGDYSVTFQHGTPHSAPIYFDVGVFKESQRPLIVEKWLDNYSTNIASGTKAIEIRSLVPISERSSLRGGLELRGYSYLDDLNNKVPFFPLPTPLNYVLKELKVFDPNGNEVNKTVFYELNRKLYLFRILDRTYTSGFHLKAIFMKNSKNSSSAASRPASRILGSDREDWTSFGTVPSKIVYTNQKAFQQTLEQMHRSGLGEIADKLDINSLRLLEDLPLHLRAIGLYSKVPEVGPKVTDDPKDFTYYQRFLKNTPFTQDSRFCYQCSGANSFLETFLIHYFRNAGFKVNDGSPESIVVETQSTFLRTLPMSWDSKSVLAAKNYHLRTRVRAFDHSWELVFDSTPVDEDPDNLKYAKESSGISRRIQKWRDRLDVLKLKMPSISWTIPKVPWRNHEVPWKNRSLSDFISHRLVAIKDAVNATLAKAEDFLKSPPVHHESSKFHMNTPLARLRDDEDLPILGVPSDQWRNYRASERGIASDMAIEFIKNWRSFIYDNSTFRAMGRRRLRNANPVKTSLKLARLYQDWVEGLISAVDLRGQLNTMGIKISESDSLDGHVFQNEILKFSIKQTSALEKLEKKYEKWSRNARMRDRLFIFSDPNLIATLTEFYEWLPKIAWQYSVSNSRCREDIKAIHEQKTRGPS